MSLGCACCRSTWRFSCLASGCPISSLRKCQDYLHRNSRRCSNGAPASCWTIHPSGRVVEATAWAAAS
eukprot:scaffold2139_cov170-Pinguiococcus_pyrenoidosus.AAC.3